MFEIWTKLAPLSGLVALCVAAILFFRVKALSPGNARMMEIGGYIREGSMAFLGREFKILAVYSAVLFAVLWGALGLSSATSFLLGAMLSLLAGFCGMQSAPAASAAQSASQPQLRPMTSTTKQRWCDAAVDASESRASMTRCSAVSHPMVMSVPHMSLSMEPTSPTTANTGCAAACAPRPARWR